MKRRLLAVLVLASVIVSTLYAQTKETPKDEGTKREKFDPKRDSEKDLQDAVALAAKTNKHILLDVGGEWCSWCHKLDKFFQDNKDVSEFLHNNFLKKWAPKMDS